MRMKAHGDFILPENIPANEFLNLEGEKISTSRNWAVWLNEYLENDVFKKVRKLKSKKKEIRLDNNVIPIGMDECQTLGEIIFEGWMKERNSEKRGGTS